MGVARRSRAEVDGGDAARREVRDVRPRLLRLDRESPPTSRSRRTSGASTTTSRRRRVADDLDGRIAGHERADERLGRRPACGRADSGGSESRRRGRGSTLSATPPSSRVTETTSKNVRPSTVASRALVGRDPREALDRAMNGVVGQPRPRRVAADAVEGHLGRQRPDAPRLDRQVGRLEQDREIGLVHEWAAVEERGQRVVLRRQLLAAEQEQRDVDRTGLESPRARVRARARRRRRPSCRSRRTRAPLRRRSARACCPARGRCRSARRARAAVRPARRSRAHS